MTASLLDGKSVAALLKQQLKDTLTSLTDHGLRAPALAVILIGDDAASSVYVNAKRNACADIGMQSCVHHLPEMTTEQQLISLIEELNDNLSMDGILVQLPLPPHINTQRIVETIAPHKDVDGFHPLNFGKLAQGTPHLRPCTPYGIIQLLDHYHIDLPGKHAVIVGASRLVGRPMAFELLLKKATVTVCQSRTTRLDQHIQNAEVIIVATGVMDLINPDWLNASQILIDVGIHRLHNGQLRGDVDFIKAREKLAWMTPVPGGVGPMTLCTLLQNTLMAYQTHHAAPDTFNKV